MPTYASMGFSSHGQPGRSGGVPSSDSGSRGMYDYSSSTGGYSGSGLDRRTGTTMSSAHESYLSGGDDHSHPSLSPIQGHDGLMQHHDQSRSRAVTFDSGAPRPSFAMWDMATAASHSPAMSTQSAMPYHPHHHHGHHPSGIDSATAATLLSPAFARQGLHPGSEHMPTHFTPVGIASSGLLTREERRASLTRANSEFPSLPSALPDPSSLQSYYNNWQR